MDKIETDCIWVILTKVAPTFFKLMANRLDIGLAYDVTIILSLEEFHITLFKFQLVINLRFPQTP